MLESRESARSARRPLRLISTAVLLVFALTACSGDGEQGNSSAPGTFPSTLPSVPKVLTQGESQRAAPRWEQVFVFSGSGPTETAAFTIPTVTIQWRVRWSCDAGTLRISLKPPPVRPGPLVDSPCPKEGEGFSIQKGDLRLNIEAIGRWKATVEHQVDTPLNEPPVPAMATGTVLSRGSFHKVDKTGKGTVELYQLPEGQLALRFSEDFEVFNDPDLVVWASELANPKTSAEVVAAPHLEIAALKSTRGSQNYLLPPGLNRSNVRSIALYCVPVPSVYIAAALP